MCDALAHPLLTRPKQGAVFTLHTRPTQLQRKKGKKTVIFVFGFFWFSASVSLHLTLGCTTGTKKKESDRKKKTQISAAADRSSPTTCVCLLLFVCVCVFLVSFNVYVSVLVETPLHAWTSMTKCRRLNGQRRELACAVEMREEERLNGRGGKMRRSTKKKESKGGTHIQRKYERKK